MNKLIVVIMGPGKKHFAEMCLDSVENADKILYWTSADELEDENQTIEFSDVDHISYYNHWDESDPTTNGKCRQRYLEHLKKNYPDDWCLVIDEDELIEDLSKIKDFIQSATPGIYSVKMRHFIGDLGHEDSTHKLHLVPNRLFKISEANKYPEHSHPVLEGNVVGNCVASTIWHLGHLPVEYLDYILTRYKQHAKDSVIHNQDFLKSWKLSHLFGQYPKREINPVELPKQLCDRYELNKDEFYFANRGLEVKHFLMVKQWHEFFNNKSVIDVGCGRGLYMIAWNLINVYPHGFDISEYAIDNFISNGDKWVGSITDNSIKYDEGGYELVTAIDVLEHLNYKDLDKAINNLVNLGRKILVSIPVLGDPNLEADSTHIIKETKEWWIKQFTDKGLKLIPTPEHFLFKEQLMIFEK